MNFLEIVLHQLITVMEFRKSQLNICANAYPSLSSYVSILRRIHIKETFTAIKRRRCAYYKFTCLFSGTTHRMRLLF